MNPMKKFWTVQNGVVGTAHKSRDGRTVDFRPGGEPCLRESPIVGGRNIIEVFPSKGVLIEPLGLELGSHCSRKVVVRKDYPNQGQQVVKETFYTRFMGVEVSAIKGQVYEWYDLAAKAEFEAHQEARWAADRARWQEENDRETTFAEKFPREKFREKATRREVSQLRSGRLSINKLLARIIMGEAENALGKINDGVVYGAINQISEEQLEVITMDILGHDDHLRAERKQQWLAKVGQGEKE